MQQIFIGLIFTFLDFNLDLGATRIGLIPDFVGYIYIAKGIAELVDYSEHFVKAIKFAEIMKIYSIGIYVANLFGLWTLDLLGLNGALSIFSTFGSLYMLYWIIYGIKEMEGKLSCSLNSEYLLKLWKIVFVINIIVYVSSIFITPLLFLIIFIGFVVTICLLYEFNNVKNMYNQVISDIQSGDTMDIIEDSINLDTSDTDNTDMNS